MVRLVRSVYGVCLCIRYISTFLFYLFMMRKYIMTIEVFCFVLDENNNNKNLGMRSQLLRI